MNDKFGLALHAVLMVFGVTAEGCDKPSASEDRQIVTVPIGTHEQDEVDKLKELPTSIAPQAEKYDGSILERGELPCPKQVSPALLESSSPLLLEAFRNEKCGIGLAYSSPPTRMERVIKSVRGVTKTPLASREGDSSIYIAELVMRHHDMSYSDLVQMVYDEEGKLLEWFRPVRWELVTIAPEEAPYLLVVEATAKGNGGHRLFRSTKSGLEDVLIRSNLPFGTYSNHGDPSRNAPPEMRLSILPQKAATQHIELSATVLMYKTPEVGDCDEPCSSHQVQYIFNRDAQGYFRAAENYEEKFSTLFYEP